MSQHLGLSPDSVADGVLQDMHWSTGSFGYFPTYTLGTIYSAVLFAQATAQLPGLEAELRSGVTDRLLQWLRDNVHGRGYRHDTKDLIEPLVCEHSQMFSRAQLGFTDFTDEERARFKPVLQRLVRTHPVTKRKSLYLSSHAGTILGWPVPEAKAFLRDLMEAATQREFVYTHKWQVGDLVMWDNRQTMHRARPFPADEPRDVRRTTLMGDAPTVAQQAA